MSNEIDVVIEIPRGSRNKYGYDHDRHIIRLDRRLFTATTYPAGDARREHVTDLDGLPDHLTDEISHFFEVYTALEPDKCSSVRGWEGAEGAWQEIRDCRQRYVDHHPT